MAIKPGRPVAMGIIDGTPFIGLPGNPVASFITFVHVVAGRSLALSGARYSALIPIPLRAAFSYKKKIGRREYVRVKLVRAKDGALERSNFRARARDCSPPSLRPMDWSNSMNRSSGWNWATASGFSAYASLSCEVVGL